VEQRAANHKFVVLLDNALKKSFGWGLIEFMPTALIKPLQEGEQRYFVEATPPGEIAERRRACVLSPDGSRRFEAPIKIDNGVRHWPVLHLSADQGSASFQALNWLCHGLQLRCTHQWDIWHRLSNDHTDAIQEAGLLIIRLSYRQVVRMRHGPWRAQSNHEVLDSAAKEFFQVTDHHNVILSSCTRSYSRTTPIWHRKSAQRLIWRMCGLGRNTNC
jgi:hypothetical protein